MRWILSVFILTFSFLMQSQAAFAEVSEKRNQLEELFIWKMSDELKLSPSEEKKFTEIVKGLNRKKAELGKALQTSLEKMGQAPNTKKKDEELNQYKKTLQSFNHLGEEELDKLKPLLGVDRTVQYLQFKQDLANRIKTTLANPDAPLKLEKKTLPAPKVIVE